jgi:hypothetical protein
METITHRQPGGELADHHPRELDQWFRDRCFPEDVPGRMKNGTARRVYKSVALGAAAG